MFLPGTGVLRHVLRISALFHVNLQMRQSRCAGQFLIKLQFNAARAFSFSIHIPDHVRRELPVRITTQTTLADLHPVQLHRLDRICFFVRDARIHHEVTTMISR